MKMSWISRRETSRDEDMAYSLLGLFDVNMPLLYGEGRKAFMRLQLEIIKKSDDESIFAWTSDIRTSGMLATWPTAFAMSGDIMGSPTSLKERLPYAMTNKGLEFFLPAIIRGGIFVGRAVDMTRAGSSYVEVTLNCWRQMQTEEQVEKSRSVHIKDWDGPVLSVDLALIGHAWRRVHCNTIGTSKKPRYPKYNERAWTGSSLPVQMSRIFVVQEGMKGNT